VKVTLENMDDVDLINWDAVRENIEASLRRAMAKALNAAADQIKDLQPGEVRVIPIENAEITISREAEVSAETAEISG
jgi:hypothetical protein